MVGKIGREFGETSKLTIAWSDVLNKLTRLPRMEEKDNDLRGFAAVF
jgi:hypothetical protein